MNRETTKSATSVTQKGIGGSTKGSVYDFDDETSEIPFEVLNTPTVSRYDRKYYKVIRLKNSLTVCIISDTIRPVDIDALLAETPEDEDSDAFDSSASSESDSSGTDDEGLAKLAEKSAMEVKMAAAALCINVGSFSDPPQVPGLAHFLEHMVFMGSEKYPQENDFDSFIKKHGGSDNASTDYELTTFYFECFEKHLEEALDKFSQFFISPLMKKDSMTREREAIESEFQLALPSDEYRKEQLLLTLAKKNTPVNSFSWGNLITLKDKIEDEELYKLLHEFRTKHYSANRMTLAVQARLPTEMLESFVLKYFDAIPNNNSPPDDFRDCVDLFDPQIFNRVYYVKPVKDICQVDLTWVLPPMKQHYKSKPHVYVSWLLGHEGQGTLLSFLKKKVWVLSLFAGNSESGAECNSIFSTFSVNIVLTKEGLAHVDEVIEAVFTYLKLIKRAGPCERIFQEIQRIEEISFLYKREQSAVDTVEDLVENMQYFPPENYLTGPVLFMEYNPEGIKDVIYGLDTEKVNVMILSSDVPEGVVFDRVEKWFNIQYTDRDIPIPWYDKWKSPKTNYPFALPLPNPFITDDFSLLKPEYNLPKYPEKILDTPEVELWYRKDQTFKLPLAYYYYYILTPYAMESPETVCMMQMFVVFFNMNIAEDGYNAQVAELSYSITSCEKGICLKINGFNQKLPILIRLIGKHLREVSENLTPDMFEAVKDKQAKSFRNALLKPSKLCKDLRLYFLQEDYFLLIEKHAAMKDITFEMMKDFAHHIFDRIYVHGLVQGNVSACIAKKTTEVLLKRLRCTALEPSLRPKIMVKQLPKGEHCCRVASFNKHSGNSIVTNYYQCNILTIKDNVILELILLLIEESLFDVLRTKEQLGYNVHSTLRDTYGVLGFSITVNTQAEKYSTEYVNSRIESFLKRSGKFMKKLDGKKFNSAKNDLIKIKQVVDVHLGDEVDRNWEEIVNLRYQFDRVDLEIKAVQKLKFDEVRDWWRKYNMFGTKSCDLVQSSVRKLSIQVVGNPHARQSNEEQEEELKGSQQESMSQSIEQSQSEKTPVTDSTVESSVSNLEEVPPEPPQLTKSQKRSDSRDSHKHGKEKDDCVCYIEEESEDDEDEYRVHQFQLLLPEDPEEALFFIDNIERFKDGLRIFVCECAPVTKVTSSEESSSEDTSAFDASSVDASAKAVPLQEKPAEEAPVNEES